MTKFEEDFQLDLEELIDGVLDDEISDSTFDGEKTKFIEKYAPQALPVVPEFVDKFLKSKPIFNIVKYPIPIEIIFWANKQTGYMDLEINITYLIKLKTNGYTVENPQLFYLKNKITGLNLVLEQCFNIAGNHVGEQFREYKMQYTADEQEARRYKNTFTQQDIDSMQTGSYEQIEVTE